MQNWKRNTILFLTSQIFSLLGSSLVQYTLMWYVTLETKSGIMMTLYIICGFVPTFLLSPFAGVLADRHNRKKIIMLSDAMIALVTLILAIVFAQGGKALWLFFIAAMIRAVGSALQGPAVGAILPQIVPTEHLTKVNGINGSMQSLIMLLSPVMSGALLNYAPLQFIFMIDVFTAAIAILVLAFFLKVPTHAKAMLVQSESYLQDMRYGFKYIKNHKYLISFFIYMALLLFFITPAAFLTPLQVARTFGDDVWRLSGLEIAFSSGMMFGGFLISLWGGFANRMKTAAVSTIIMSLCTIILGVVPNFTLFLIFMAIFGIAMPFFNTPTAVIIQEHVEESYMGRVFSVQTMLFTSVMPFSMLLYGPLAEVIKIEWILIFTGVLMLLLALTVPFNKLLLEIGIKPKVKEGIK